MASSKAPTSGLPQQLSELERPKKAKGSKQLLLSLLSLMIFGYLSNRSIYRQMSPILQKEDKLLMEAPSKKDATEPKTWWRGIGNRLNVSHPHLGARSWNKKGEEVLQMIVDPSVERLAPSKNDYTNVDPGILCPVGPGIEGEKGNEVLLKVRSGIGKYNNRLQADNDHKDEHGRKHRTTKSKILCMVYTVDIPEARSNLKGISETWGKKCDGYFAASNVTDHSLGAIDLIHQGPEAYGNMWQKIRSMWAYAYDHYLNEYDFFHICGDDVYMVVENLRSFLDGPDVLRLENDGYLDEIARHHAETAKKWTGSDYYKGVHGLSARPLWFGNPGRYNYKIIPCGGPGYTLNRAALELFGKVGLESFLANNTDSREDVFMGGFFFKQGVTLSHVIDRFANGHRFGETADIAYAPFRETVSRCPKAYDFMKKINLTTGDYLEAVSEEFSVFHLKDAKTMLKEQGHTVAELMHRYHAILYDLC